MNRVTDKLLSRTTALLICFALTLMVWGVFAQTLRHEFVNYDDNRYVYGNPDVSLGLSRTGIEQAFTKRYVGIWLPLTIISYQFDHELSGLNPSRFHQTNVLLHAATSILLFLVLRLMTGSLWRSAFVAALFAIHPLRAESVAWISERKDVLSSLFFMLSLGAYARYARVCRAKGAVMARRYLLMVLFFVLGLLSKPMVVTLPFVLLLLDFWPLNRFETAGTKKLVLEKIPLFLLSVIFCAIAVWTERDIITVDEEVSVLWRMGNAVVSYMIYIKQMIAPFGLAMFYPHPGTELPIWQISVSFLFLTMLSLTAVFFWKKKPYLIVGWLWYLGMLVPVIGIIPAWLHAYADRYTYLPQIGLYIFLTWAIAELSARWKYRHVILGAAALLLLAGLGAKAWVQTSHWRSSETLWTHTLAHTEDNKIANYNMAVVLERQGKSEMAIEQYRRALRVWPEDADALINLGCALAEKNELATAARLFHRALKIRPNSPEARTNLGLVFAKQGDIKKGIEYFQQALKIKSDYLEAHVNLGFFLGKQGKVEEAISSLQRALEINPDNVIAQRALNRAKKRLLNQAGDR